MKNDLLVSVIIPVRVMSYYLLFETLPALAKQTYPHFEVLILPNDHTAYDSAILKQYAWLRIIPTGKVTRPAEKRNIGSENAKGKILAFLDDDAYPHAQWLEQAVHVFDTKKCSAVCGPGVIPPSSSLFEQVFDEVLGSPLGSGGFVYRFIPQTSRSVDDYPSMNFLIQSSDFEKVGKFRENYWPGEDSKLCEALVQKGKKIWYDPGILVYHHRRSKIVSFILQHKEYGFHRGSFFSQGDVNSQKLIYTVPSLFVIYIIFFLFLSPIFLLTNKLIFLYISLSPVLIYFFFTLIYGVRSSMLRRKYQMIFVMPVVFFCIHIVYGVYFIKGLVVGRRKK